MGGSWQVIDIHLDEERGQFSKKAFVHKYLNGDLDCRPWVGAQQLSLGHYYGEHRRLDFEHLELNEVGEGRPPHDESSVLLTDMHAKYI